MHVKRKSFSCGGFFLDSFYRAFFEGTFFCEFSQGTLRGAFSQSYLIKEPLFWRASFQGAFYPARLFFPTIRINAAFSYIFMDSILFHKPVPLKTSRKKLSRKVFVRKENEGSYTVLRDTMLSALNFYWGVSSIVLSLFSSTMVSYSPVSFVINYHLIVKITLHIVYILIYLYVKLNVEY